MDAFAVAIERLQRESNEQGIECHRLDARLNEEFG
jgi:hypothetical protein